MSCYASYRGLLFMKRVSFHLVVYLPISLLDWQTVILSSEFHKYFPEFKWKFPLIVFFTLNFDLKACTDPFKIKYLFQESCFCIDWSCSLYLTGTLIHFDCDYTKTDHSNIRHPAVVKKKKVYVYYWSMSWYHFPLQNKWQNIEINVRVFIFGVNWLILIWCHSRKHHDRYRRASRFTIYMYTVPYDLGYMYNYFSDIIKKKNSQY